MEKVIGALVFAILTCACVNAGMAQVAQTVPTTAYPDPQCTKPDVNLVKPMKFEGNLLDPGDTATYNAKARAYNSQVKAFNQASESYIQAYVDSASREVKRIQDQANAAMDAIQAKIKRAAIELNDLAAQENSPQ